MRRFTRAALALALVAGLAYVSTGHADEDAAAAFREANALFASGDYEAAAGRFASVLDQGRFSTALLYDLANAESKRGDVGAAVLGYERALSLAPRDPDVLANLRQTRAAANLTAPVRDRWQSAAAFLTVDGWSWLAAAALWLACLLVGAYALRADAERRVPRVLVGLVTALTIFIAITASLARTRLAELDRAVVVGAGATLRVAPFEASTSSTEVVAGDLVDVERAHEGFFLVRTSEGQAGWMPREHLERILPR